MGNLIGIASRTWKQALAYDEKGRLLPLAGNVMYHMLYNRSIYPTVPLSMNEMDGTVHWCVDWMNGSSGEQLSSEHLVAVQCEVYNALRIKVPTNELYTALCAVAAANRFCPARDMVESVEWDGVKRMDVWLSEYCGVAASYTSSIIGRKWLISAIARLFEPGCQADCMLVLRGPQGLGKTSILRALGGEWFTTLSTIAGKDAMEGIRGKWIVELGELEAMRGRAAESVKQFISTNKDYYRKPYARAASENPRRCVFAGTTNQDQFISDPTGARRFWVVDVGYKGSPEALERDKRQLLAEAYAAYRAGEKWWFTDDRDESTVSAAAETAQEIDPWYEIIQHFVEGRERVKIKDLFEDMEISADRQGTHSVRRAAAVLKELGFAQRRTKSERIWERIKE